MQEEDAGSEEVGNDFFSIRRHAVPRKALGGGISKSIIQRPCQFLAMNAHQMAPRMTQWFQERHWNAPTMQAGGGGASCVWVETAE
jgi:hypothetical protein